MESMRIEGTGSKSNIVIAYKKQAIKQATSDKTSDTIESWETGFLLI